MMNGYGKSDSLILPEKPSNKAGATEEVEGRRLAKGNRLGQNVLRTQGRASAYNELGLVREADWSSLALSSLPEAGAV
jgi:hypothetical protein